MEAAYSNDDLRRDLETAHRTRHFPENIRQMLWEMALAVEDLSDDLLGVIEIYEVLAAKATQYVPKEEVYR